MKKGLVVIMVLFIMILNMMLNLTNPTMYMAEDDEYIDWNSYIEKIVVWFGNGKKSM